MWIRIKIAWAIIFKCKHERVGQFIVNRLKLHTDLYYLEDSHFLYRINCNPVDKPQILEEYKKIFPK